MYALYLAGPLVEQLYGSRLFLLFYVLCAAAGSVASFVFGDGSSSVGASGAIFGLFGILLAASRTHHPALDRRGRALVGQIGTLIVINLVIGFASFHGSTTPPTSAGSSRGCGSGSSSCPGACRRFAGWGASRPRRSARAGRAG